MLTFNLWACPDLSGSYNKCELTEGSISDEMLSMVMPEKLTISQGEYAGRYVYKLNKDKETDIIYANSSYRSSKNSNLPTPLKKIAAEMTGLSIDHPAIKKLMYSMSYTATTSCEDQGLHYLQKDTKLYAYVDNPTQEEVELMAEAIKLINLTASISGDESMTFRRKSPTSIEVLYKYKYGSFVYECSNR